MELKNKFSKKGFGQPDETRSFKNGHLDIVQLADRTSVGRFVFEPGWKWSNDVKALAGTESCQELHTGYVLKGTVIVRMDSGEEFKLMAGDVFNIPPGHDGWVEGNETFEALDFTGISEYALEKKKAA